MEKKTTTETLYLGDSLEILKTIPNESIDLVFADPPYNLQISKTLYRPNQTKVEGLGDTEWDKFASFKDYDEFTEKWLKEIKRVLKPNGTIWVIGSYHNIFRIGKILQDLNFWILNDIIWAKTNPLPNFKGTRFTNAHETIIWASHNKASKYNFNYSSMKIFNDDKQMSSIWEMNICGGKERLKINNKTAHPTQKPKDLLLRVLLASSNTFDTILDPFLGTGTTGEVAKLLQRNFIGIEKNEIYFNLAKERIANTNKIDLSSIQFQNPKANQRISLANLILANLINVNDTLYDKTLEQKAHVLLDGSIKTACGINGSIHKVAEALLNKRVNAWDFWYIKKNNQLISINTIRQHYFKELSK